MTTMSQSHLNRMSPQRATGPVTEAGKARSAQNARTHGFTAKSVNISAEERAAFDHMSADLRAEIRPAGCLEEEIFHRILSHTWNLRRIETFEMILLAEFDPLAETDLHAAKLDRCARYRRDLERSLYRAIAELRKLQTERVALQGQPELAETAPLAEATRLTKRTPLAPKSLIMRSECREIESSPMRT